MTDKPDVHECEHERAYWRPLTEQDVLGWVAGGMQRTHNVRVVEDTKERPIVWPVGAMVPIKEPTA